MAIIAYYRVSTSRQGVSGLGLEAQAATVENHAAKTGERICKSYTEIESGRNAARPQLNLAVQHATQVGATLVVAKLDRLARDAKFLLTLVDTGAKVVFCDLPELATGDPIVGRLTLTVLAAIAEFEGRRIGQRVKEALGRLKERNGGKATWHRPNLTNQHRLAGNKVACKVHKVKYTRYVNMMVPIIKGLEEEGMNLDEIAGELNVRGYKTFKKNDWSKRRVSQLLTSSALTSS